MQVSRKAMKAVSDVHDFRDGRAKFKSDGGFFKRDAA